jgi:hypothetical protein
MKHTVTAFFVGGLADGVLELSQVKSRHIRPLKIDPVLTEVPAGDAPPGAGYIEEVYRLMMATETGNNDLAIFVPLNIGDGDARQCIIEALRWGVKG